MNNDINDLVSAFLQWKLPEDFSPDGGIEYTPTNHPDRRPIGTNLLNAEQAEQMFLEIFAHEYLKENETVADCIQRNRDDVSKTLRLLANEKFKNEDLEKENNALKIKIDKLFKGLNLTIKAIDFYSPDFQESTYWDTDDGHIVREIINDVDII